MILIGQYDSPFVRRVGIVLRLYGLGFEHRPWSVFGNTEEIRAYNPLVRVPTLVLDDGDVLIESHVMLDYLESLAPAGKALLPKAEPARRRALKTMALATGLADKAVALFYEQRLHSETSALWVERCTKQILGALAALEAEKHAQSGPYWGGDSYNLADITVAAVLRHFRESQPDLVEFTTFPALAAHCAAMEALPVFAEISQPFIAPT